MMNIDLRDRVILVTGASGGIGKAAAKYLARCGATIAVHYNQSAQHAKKLVLEIGNKARVFQADLSKPPSCIRLFKRVLNAYKKIDALVNNAGIYDYSPISKDSNEWLSDWNRTITTNLTSTAVLCREAIKHFRKTGGGRIINIASRSAFRGDDKDHLAYAAAKGGMVALSKSIARAYGKDNIKSFVVAPGYVRTRMTDAFFKRHEQALVSKELALNRVTEPEDIAPTIVFLVSGLMDHATGCSIDINAGSYVR